MLGAAEEHAGGAEKHAKPNRCGCSHSYVLIAKHTNNMAFAGLYADCPKASSPWISAHAGHTSTMLDCLGAFSGDHQSSDIFCSPFQNALSPFLGVSPLACLPLDGDSSYCELPLGACMPS
jgi:hypothetical protein